MTDLTFRLGKCYECDAFPLFFNGKQEVRDDEAWVVTVTGAEHAVATLHKKVCHDVASTIAAREDVPSLTDRSQPTNQEDHE